MAIQLRNTSDCHASGIKALVYGAAGAGKTSLSVTMPKPIIISAEGGLLSISDSKLPYIEVSSMESLMEAYSYVFGPEGGAYESVILDSISEVAEVVLSYEKTINKDGRAAYGEMNVQMTSLIRAFRDLPGKHVLFTAKLDKALDEAGRMLYSPAMPGNKLAQSLPYFFDLVLPLRVEKDADGVVQRALMTYPDGIWTAKDRSGKLDQWEAPDMGAIIGKISEAGK